MLQELLLIQPLLLIGLGALFALLLGVFAGSRVSFLSALLTLVVALVSCINILPQIAVGKLILGGFLYLDGLSLFSVLLIIVGTIIVLVFSFSQLGDGLKASKEGVDYKAEFYCLLLLSSLGACILSMAAHISVFFIALELMSLSIYCLCGSAIWKEKSSESALKYFILGSFSSAVLLYGFSLLFALTGELGFVDIAARVSALNSELLLIAIALVSAGVLMKLSVFPFHFWTADVYQGAPSPVTAFMASVVKVASFSAAIRIFWMLFGSLVAFWSEFLPILAVITMCVGTFMAIRQSDIKRMLAFSSIAHSGYLMVGLLSGATESQGIAALLFYICLYMFMTLGAFDVVGALVSEKGDSKISTFKGFAKEKPLAALLLSFFLLCLAGLPPGVVGLVSKIQLFTAAVRADYVWVVVIALLNSAAGCYYYLRVIRVMYSQELTERESEPDTSTSSIAPSSLGVAVLCAAILLYFSILPGPLLSWCKSIADLG